MFTLSYTSVSSSGYTLVIFLICLFCSRALCYFPTLVPPAGAKKVYAVEASDVAFLCKEIVEENSMDEIIEVIHSPVEKIELPTKVDIIVSEWMGFYLLHESMLDSVIVARDKFLCSGGIMAPSHATIRMAPVDMTEHFQDRADEWSNIYGFDFSPVASAINRNEVVQPLVECLCPDVLRSEPQELLNLDLRTVTLEEVKKFTTSLEFCVPLETKIHGFACWFDVDFNVKVSEAKNDHESLMNFPSSISVNEKGDAKCDGLCSTNTTASSPTKQLEEAVSLRTGPKDPPTHWKQTVIFLPQTIAVGAGTNLTCRVTMSQDIGRNKRHYNITVALTNGTEEEEEEDDSEDEGAESDTSTDHPVPCQCGSARCRLIAALVEKYDMEHEELGDEAELVEVEAEVIIDMLFFSFFFCV